jgi:hypothetical protein
LSTLNVFEVYTEDAELAEQKIAGIFEGDEDEVLSELR